MHQCNFLWGCFLRFFINKGSIKFATTREFVLPELNRQPHGDYLTSSILELVYLGIKQTHFDSNPNNNNNDFPRTKPYISCMRKRQ